MCGVLCCLQSVIIIIYALVPWRSGQRQCDTPTTIGLGLRSCEATRVTWPHVNEGIGSWKLQTCSGLQNENNRGAWSWFCTASAAAVRSHPASCHLNPSLAWSGCGWSEQAGHCPDTRGPWCGHCLHTTI